MPSGDRPQSSLADLTRRARRGPVALGLGTTVALAAAAVLAYSVATTASARMTGGTGSASLLQAAVIELASGSGGDGAPPGQGQADLAIDAEGLYPGLLVERCVQLRYRGSLDTVDVVLWATVRSGSGLEDHLATTVAVGEGADPGCGDFQPGVQRFNGTLAQLVSSHPSYEQGLRLAPVGVDAPTTVRFQLQVVSDNEAQRRTTDVTLAFEVRP